MSAMLDMKRGHAAPAIGSGYGTVVAMNYVTAVGLKRSSGRNEGGVIK